MKSLSIPFTVKFVTLFKQQWIQTALAYTNDSNINFENLLIMHRLHLQLCHHVVEVCECWR